MDTAKPDSGIKVGQVVRCGETFDIKAAPCFYRVIGKDSEMHDIEVVEDSSIRLKVHISTSSAHL